jgi:hypothetical protein
VCVCVCVCVCMSIINKSFIMGLSLLQLYFGKFLPKTYLLIIDEKNFWKKLIKKWEKKLDQIEVNNITEGSVSILLGKAQLGNEVAIRFLSYVDNEIDELTNIVPVNLRHKLKKTICQFVIESDIVSQKKPNPAYLNWLAEMLSLKKILSSNSYQLIDFEAEQLNNKKFDFHLKDTSNDVFVEVMNIHITNEYLVSLELIEKFIRGKLQQKIDDKYKNLADTTRRYLLPVVWFDNEAHSLIVESLHVFGDFPNIVISPCAFMKYRDNGEYVFATIESLKN